MPCTTAAESSSHSYRALLDLSQERLICAKDSTAPLLPFGFSHFRAAVGGGSVESVRRLNSADLAAIYRAAR